MLEYTHFTNSMDATITKASTFQGALSLDDCEDLEQQLARLEESFNLLDALRADLQPDELYLLALNGMCDLQPYPVGSLWVCRDGHYRAVATTGMDSTRERQFDAAIIDNETFSRLLAAAERHGGVSCLYWPLVADVPAPLRTAVAHG